MNNSEFGDDSILDWYNTNSGSYGYFHKKEKTKNKKQKRKKKMLQTIKSGNFWQWTIYTITIYLA